jgi:hypothetical protein
MGRARLPVAPLSSFTDRGLSGWGPEGSAQAFAKGAKEYGTPIYTSCFMKEGYAGYVSPSNIGRLEHYFDERAAYENQLLHFGLGMDQPEDDVKHTLARFSSSLLKNRENVIDCQNFKMSSYQRGKRPVDQPEVRRKAKG